MWVSTFDSSCVFSNLYDTSNVFFNEVSSNPETETHVDCESKINLLKFKLFQTLICVAINLVIFICLNCFLW